MAVVRQAEEIAARLARETNNTEEASYKTKRSIKGGSMIAFFVGDPEARSHEFACVLFAPIQRFLNAVFAAEAATSKLHDLVSLVPHSSPAETDELVEARLAATKTELEHHIWQQMGGSYQWLLYDACIIYLRSLGGHEPHAARTIFFVQTRRGSHWRSMVSTCALH